MCIISFFKKIFGKKDKNSITVDRVFVDSLNFEGNGGMYFIKGNNYVHIFGSRYTKSDKQTRHFELTCKFMDGFMSDGASAPDLAKHFVPDVKLGDDLYNAAPFVHDGLYMYEGNITGANLTREECDDILRGIWRNAGMSRPIAGIADIGIYAFAGSDKHWGDDSNNCKHCFEGRFEYR